jgi:hypothetical protein
VSCKWPATTRSSCSPTASLAVRVGRAPGRPDDRALRAAGIAGPDLLYRQQASSARQVFKHKDNLQNPPPSSLATRCSPMCSPPTGSPSITRGRDEPLAALPGRASAGVLCEVSPALAAERGLEHMGAAQQRRAGLPASAGVLYRGGDLRGVRRDPRAHAAVPAAARDLCERPRAARGVPPTAAVPAGTAAKCSAGARAGRAPWLSSS